LSIVQIGDYDDTILLGPVFPNMRLPIGSFLVALCEIALNSVEALAQDKAAAEDFSSTTLGKVAIAVISATLSLFVGYILLYLKERREPTKRISYNTEAKKGMLGIEERLAQDLSVLYKGKSATNIYYVRCELLNTGSSIVRDQQVRFEFPAGTEVLDWSVDPKPPKELGLNSANVNDDGPNEKTFTFKHMEKTQKVIFHFVVVGDSPGEVRVYGYNAEDDVQVVAGEIGAATDDRRILERFLFIYLMTIFIPPILSHLRFFGIVTMTVDLAVALFYAIAAIAVFPILPDVARIVSRLIASAKPTSTSISVGHLESSTLVVGTGNILTGSPDEVPPRQLIS
jgi:hypothetical protein